MQLIQLLCWWSLFHLQVEQPGLVPSSLAGCLSAVLGTGHICITKWWKNGQFMFNFHVHKNSFFFPHALLVLYSKTEWFVWDNVYFYLSIGSSPNPVQAQINFEVDFKIVTFKNWKKKNLSYFYSVSGFKLWRFLCTVL